MPLYGRVNLGGGSSTKYPVGNVTNLSIKVGNEQLTIFWNDPVDTSISTWKGTKLIYKEGSYPTNENDGTTVLTNEERDKYAEDGYTIQNLTNGTTYYFKLFPYTTENAYTNDEENQISGTPQAYRIMTVKIDLTNSNPETCCSYDDDAIGMEVGSEAWDEFFGHYPCLVKDKEEVGNLNPNNFAEFEDGTSADITSGDAGDVMIAFPRRGLKIETSSDGNTVTISMTDDLDNTDFKFMAHTRGETVKEKFYLGAYEGYNISNKLRSLSGKTPIVDRTIGIFRRYARNNGASDGNGGSGYDQFAFYQLTYIQVMYLLKYKNLDSQTAVGRGYVDGNWSSIATGNTNTKGMDFGETTGKQQMKLFGLEDLWGNIHDWIDGLFCNSSRYILTATQGFNNTGSGYTNQGQEATSDIDGYMTKPQGTTETGFIIKQASGSITTYFCDYGDLSAGCLPNFGGNWDYGSGAGAFCLNVYYSASFSYADIGARLMLL